MYVDYYFFVGLRNWLFLKAKPRSLAPCKADKASKREAEPRGRNAVFVEVRSLDYDQKHDVGNPWLKNDYVDGFFGSELCASSLLDSFSWSHQ